MIVFGELDYSKLDLVTYNDPNSNSAPALINLRESMLHLMGDGFEQLKKPLFGFFPILMRKGFGSSKKIHQNANSLRESITKFAKNNTKINPHSILHQLLPLHTTPESFDMLIKNLIVFLVAGADTVSHTYVSTLYYLHSQKEK